VPPYSGLIWCIDYTPYDEFEILKKSLEEYAKVTSVELIQNDVNSQKLLQQGNASIVEVDKRFRDLQNKMYYFLR